MNTSDWVLVCTSLFLGACALFVPYLAELLKRKLFAPKIKISFQLLPPFCHKTLLCSHPSVRPCVEEPVYYFRFMVTNNGKSRANNCEIYLEKLWMYDASQTPRLYPSFSPLNMAWSGNHSQKFLDINHGKIVYCDIGHIASEKYQHNTEKREFVDHESAMLSRNTGGSRNVV